MRLEDEQIRIISLYLEENPPLRSLTLAGNVFSDDGLIELITALKKNERLNHLNMLDCLLFTDRSLIILEEMITEINMSLYNIEITPNRELDSDLLDRIQYQGTLNRAI